jgi:VanZ family protein
MPRLPRQPRFWLSAFLIWFGILWVLSSFSFNTGYAPPVNHIDKVQHFGYFLGGSGLLCAYLYRRNPDRPNWRAIFTTAIVLVSLVGLLDEWHQSFTPGRSGNDPGDWMADFLGAVTGALVFKRIHHRLKWHS